MTSDSANVSSSFSDAMANPSKLSDRREFYTLSTSIIHSCLSQMMSVHRCSLDFVMYSKQGGAAWEEEEVFLTAVSCIRQREVAIPPKAESSPSTRYLDNPGRLQAGASELGRAALESFAALSVDPANEDPLDLGPPSCTGDRTGRTLSVGGSLARRVQPWMPASPSGRTFRPENPRASRGSAKSLTPRTPSSYANDSRTSPLHSVR